MFSELPAERFATTPTSALTPFSHGIGCHPVCDTLRKVRLYH
jgi:hypothetical protein